MSKWMKVDPATLKVVDEARDILGNSRPYVGVPEVEQQWVEALDRLETRVAEAQGE